MLKRIICALLAAIIGIGPSFSEEISLPEIAASISTSTQSGFSTPDWSGAYSGVQLGYGQIDTNLAGIDGNGAVAGLTAGYDYDLGSWILGGGIDYDFANVGLANTADLENVLRLKLRGGKKMGNGLLYASGGYAKAHTDTLGDDDGYFLGAGYEHMLSTSFGIGGELLYHDFANFNGTNTDIEASTLQVRGTFRF